jgi:hypothetical protein
MSRRKSRFRNRPSGSSSGPSASSAPRAARAVREPAAPVTPEVLGEQYHYAIGDLERVGITAGALIAVMILLRIFVIK